MKKREEIIESKVGPSFFSINVRAAARRLAGTRYEDAVVLERLERLIEGHGLQSMQLLRLLPPEYETKAADLLDDERLLGVLDSATLAWLASMFGIRRSWLEGAEDRIYEPLRAYKCLDSFFRMLEQMGVLDRDLQPFLLHGREEPFPDPLHRRQMPVLVLSHPMAAMDDRTIRQYVICGDQWVYGHPPVRFHLKAIARVFFKAFATSTILVPVRREELDAVRQGMLIPQWLPEGSGGYEMFEEYALSAEESQIAQEIEELPMVLELIGKSEFLKGLLERT